MSRAARHKTASAINQIDSSTGHDKHGRLTFSGGLEEPDLSRNMFIKRPERLPMAPYSVRKAAVAALARSSQWQAAIRPWIEAQRLYHQERRLWHVEGDFSRVVVNARVAFTAQILVTAELLYRDPRVQKHWDWEQVPKVLVDLIKLAVGEPTPEPWVVKSPRGNPFASQRDYARFFDGGLDEFRERVRKWREALGPNASHYQIWSSLGMPSATYYRYLKDMHRQDGIKRESAETPCVVKSGHAATDSEPASR